MTEFTAINIKLSIDEVFKFIHFMTVNDCTIMKPSSTDEPFDQHHQNTQPCLSICQCTLLHLLLTTVTQTLLYFTRLKKLPS